MRIYDELIAPQNLSTSPANLIDWVCRHAQHKADKTAYIFLQDGETESARITYAELHQRASAIAAQLQKQELSGERALLLYPPGFDYIEGFLACLYAGVIAVPAYPPSKRHQARLFAVINDAKPAVVLTTGELKQKLVKEFADTPMSQHDLNWLATDDVAPVKDENWVKPDLSSDSLAFLQYTSGTTGDPKGVMVTHGNLMANQASIQQGFEHTEDSIVVGWLPLYHDMGLIGNLLQPLYLGATAILMPPMAFLEKPVRWLRAISNYNAETSGGPNFAYDLCCQKITPEQMQGLDLSSWELAFNGSEPVHDKTMQRFTEKFSACGFQSGSFYPCYGLAEATLFVSGNKLLIETVDNARSDSGQALSDTTRQVNSVSCGSILAAQQLRIVNPETHLLCAKEEEGEIWLSGANITQGYWNKPELSEHMFKARIIGQDQSLTEKQAEAYLRTGDLGFVRDGQLHVSGRIKDLIIIRGRNFYPQDIERNLTENIPELVTDGCVAFSVIADQQEKLVVVAELTRTAMRQKNYSAITTNMRQVLMEMCEIMPEELLLVRLGTVPKTSSGKNRRQASKQMYLENEFTELFRSGAAPHTSDRSNNMDDIVATPSALSAELQMLRQALSVVPAAHRSGLISQFLCNKIALFIKQEPSGVTSELSLPAFGLDSLKVVELKHAVDQLLDIDAPLSLFLSDSSVTEIAQQLARFSESLEQTDSNINDKGEMEDTADLSSTQLSMWTMQQLEPDSIIYNLHLALTFQGRVELEKLQQAFRHLLSRHSQLRTVYRNTEDDQVIQQVLATEDVAEILSVIDAGSWSKDQIQEDIGHKARQPFDLSKGPLIRTNFYQQHDAENTLLICAHHIAIDLWSVLILIDELKTIYTDLVAGQALQLPVLSSAYRDYTQWQQQYMQSPDSQKDWDYWQQQLSGELPLLALPTDQPRPTVSDYRGASIALQLSKEKTRQLKMLAREQGVTLFALLLTAYKVLLYRYTHQDDLIVGIPTSGRVQSRFSSVVGNFVNPLPLRSYPRADQSFTDYLAEINTSLLSGLQHQDFPFNQIVDRLQPERIADHWPIYQTMFVLQQAQANMDKALAQFALGEDGNNIIWEEFPIKSLAQQQRVENFDLKLMASEFEDGLQFSFQYRCDLYDQQHIVSWAVHFHKLISGIINNAQLKLSAFPLLSSDEQQQITLDWNNTEVSYAGAISIHQLFEAQVEKTPDNTALLFQDKKLSYQELNEHSNRVAHGLIQMDLKRNAAVGICAERSLEMVIGMLGILKAGCAYLPLAPDYPEERLTAMVDDAKVSLILVQSGFTRLFDSFPQTIRTLDSDLSDFDNTEKHNPEISVNEDDLVYVLFTSGSTGRPKGVGVPYRGVINHLHWMQAHFNFTQDDVIMQKTPYTFDVSVSEFFCPIIVGASLLMAETDDHKDPECLISLIEQHDVTTLDFVPSMLGAFLNAIDYTRCRSLRRVICNGEVLSKTLQTLFYQRSKAQLFNVYGPTEATVNVTAWLCSQEQETVSVPIGIPVANCQIYILDEYFQPVPKGVVGELYIGGTQLARGYINQPGLTAERFIPNPFNTTGERLYRTGDLAYHANQGLIHFVGRADHQVKVRGFRIELGEIESVLLKNPDVKDAVVIVRDDGPSEQYLAAYWVSKIQADSLNTEELQNALKEHLPDYMVPSVFIKLDALPLSANGKLDRKALPVPDFSEQFADQYIAPRNEVETMLANIWSDLLNLQQVGIHDNFFALGGDSILSIQVSSRAHQAGWVITPRQLFDYQTIATLALVVEKTAQETEDLQIQQTIKAYEPFSLSKLSDIELNTLRQNHKSMEDAYPLSSMQEGILFHTLSSPGSGVYVMQDHYEIVGKVDIDAFRQAWQSVMDNNPVLRTRFDWNLDEQPLQIVNGNTVLPFEYLDWSQNDEKEQKRKLEKLLRSEQKQGFDLRNDFLFRIRIIKCDSERHYCIRSYHHILIDEWCTSPMFLEFREYYGEIVNGEPLVLKKVPPYRNYIAWLEGQNKEKTESYWRNYLDGYSEPMALTEKKGLATANIHSSVDDVTVQLSNEDTQALTELSKQYYLTPNTFVQGALALLLSQYEGRSDIVYGVTVSGRPSSLPDAENILGLFINALPLRITINDSESILDWLSKLQQKNLEMRQYEYTSLVDIQFWSSIPRTSGELFQHLLTFENAPIDSSLLNDRDVIDMHPVWNRVHTNYPITFVAIPSDQLNLRITYQTELFNARYIQQMIDCFKALLEAMIHAPNKRLAEIGLLGSDQQLKILQHWNQTQHQYAKPCDIVASLEAQAIKSPDAIAVSFQGQDLTYLELNHRVNRAAHALVENGVQPETLVALYNDRGIDYMVMMLSVFKAGAAYMPLDPNHPDARIVQVLNESKADFVLTHATGASRMQSLSEQPVVLVLDNLLGNQNTANPVRRHLATNMAFVIFTSGSTGLPKGAMVEHQGMYNNLITKVPTLGLTEQDVIAQTAAQCFDISVWQHLTALVCGAKVEIISDEIVKEPHLLLSHLAESKVTILEAVPSMIQALLDIADESDKLPELRWLIACGEAFPPDLCRRWMERYPHVNVLNAYGPAECSDDVSYYQVAGIPAETETIVPIGKAVHNTQLYLLNHWQQPVPIGVPGEICVAGIQVGRGYLGRPNLTAEKFIPDPFAENGGRLYRTGDVGRYQEDGTIEFLGRVDHQVKIRGVRIEPGEIEEQILAFANIDQAFVMDVEDYSSGKRLVAYIVSKSKDQEDVELITELRHYLSNNLPAVMVPSAFVVLETLPYSSNGKIDRKALPKPDMNKQSDHAFVAARNPAEETLVEIWQEVLSIEKIGVKDNFFELGGHSLLAVQVLSRIRKAFGIEVPLRQLFEAATIEELALLVEEVLIEHLSNLSEEEAEAMLNDE